MPSSKGFLQKLRDKATASEYLQGLMEENFQEKTKNPPRQIKDPFAAEKENLTEEEIEGIFGQRYE